MGDFHGHLEKNMRHRCITWTTTSYTSPAKSTFATTSWTTTSSTKGLAQATSPACKTRYKRWTTNATTLPRPFTSRPRRSMTWMAFQARSATTRYRPRPPRRRRPLLDRPHGSDTDCTTSSRTNSSWPTRRLRTAGGWSAPTSASTPSARTASVASGPCSRRTGSNCT